jgi:hypothetical protein
VGFVGLSSARDASLGRCIAAAPGAFLAGGVFVLADVITSRRSAAELPVGVVTALVGAGFALLLRRKLADAQGGPRREVPRRAPPRLTALRSRGRPPAAVSVRATASPPGQALLGLVPLESGSVSLHGRPLAE